MSERLDVTSWQKIFVTRIIAPADLPDIQIVSLPAPPTADAPLDINGIHRALGMWDTQDIGFKYLGGSPVMLGEEECRRALLQAIIEAADRQNTPSSQNRWELYANNIFNKYDIPVQNSPLTGSSLAGLSAGGGGAAFMAAFGALDGTHIALYFLMIGGTRLIIGGADIILKLVDRIVLKWSNTPTQKANAEKLPRNVTRDQKPPS